MIEIASAGSKVKGSISMWNFKKCPRCRGDIFIDEDIEGDYEKCLQCGYERALEKATSSRKNRRSEKEKSGVV